MSDSDGSQLRAAMYAGALVRFSRAFEQTEPRGYVLDVGPEFFALALVSDRLWYDGFECFRLADVCNVRVDPYATFVEAALMAREQSKPDRSSVALSTLTELLLSAAVQFPLVAIHKELVDVDICWIGRVVDVSEEIVLLLEVNPDATWDVQPTIHKLSDITRVSFGGDYEEALSIVAGASPSMPAPSVT